MKFQVAQPIASLIINKWLQLLPLLGHWFYRWVSTLIHPWLPCLLVLEKPLDLTLSGKASASMGTSPPIVMFFATSSHSLASSLSRKGVFPQFNWNLLWNSVHQITNAKPSQSLAAPGKIPSSVSEILSMFHSVWTESLTHSDSSDITWDQRELIFCFDKYFFFLF